MKFFYIFITSCAINSLCKHDEETCNRPIFWLITNTLLTLFFVVLNSRDVNDIFDRIKEYRIKFQPVIGTGL